MSQGSFFCHYYNHKLIMKFIIKLFKLNFFLFSVCFFCFNSNAENHIIYETIELIQKDIKTLEKAVYSGSLQTNENLNNISSSNLDLNSEDVLTRHLLKLSEIENQFKELTNRFEEINFKLDKLSNRLSKVQADNQLRFQELENGSFSSTDNKKITKKNDDKELLPGS